MQHILLTWNPGPGNDKEWTPEQWESEMVVGTAEGRTLEGEWSVGNRRHGIGRGDRGYLFRQGVHGRGICGIAEIESEPYDDESWRGDGSTTRYVEVRWQECVALADMLMIDELKTAIPGFKWDSVYSSGREITEYGDKLAALWADRARVAPPGPRITQGAGFGTADQNTKVETAAIREITRRYRAAGYQVTSVESENCGWDLTVTKGDKEIHVEAKGVAGSLARFLLTPNEYRVAATDPGWRLIVVTNALGAPRMFELAGDRAIANAAPALYQVRVPDADLTQVSV